MQYCAEKTKNYNALLDFQQNLQKLEQDQGRLRVTGQADIRDERMKIAHLLNEKITPSDPGRDKHDE
jgi:hypothetical protein